MTLAQIEQLTKEFAEARERLAQLVGDIESELQAVKRRHMAQLKRFVAGTAERHARLKEAIDSSPALFTKPRTLIINGVKVGFQKGKGGIEFDDADRVVELIHKYFGDKADTLLLKIERPCKDAIAELPAVDLKRIGCTVVASGDQVVIKPARDGEVDKIVNALLKDAVDDQSVKEAA